MLARLKGQLNLTNRPAIALLLATIGVWFAAHLPLAYAVYVRDEPSIWMIDAVLIVAGPVLGLLLERLFPTTARLRLFGTATVLFLLTVAAFAVPNWTTTLSSRGPDASAIRAFVTHDQHLLVAVLTGIVGLALLGQRAVGLGEALKLDCTRSLRRSLGTSLQAGLVGGRIGVRGRDNVGQAMMRSV